MRHDQLKYLQRGGIAPVRIQRGEPQNPLACLGENLQRAKFGRVKACLLKSTLTSRAKDRSEILGRRPRKQRVREEHGVHPRSQRRIRERHVQTPQQILSIRGAQHPLAREPRGMIEDRPGQLLRATVVDRERQLNRRFLLGGHGEGLACKARRALHEPGSLDSWPSPRAAAGLGLGARRAGRRASPRAVRSVGSVGGRPVAARQPAEE